MVISKGKSMLNKRNNVVLGFLMALILPISGSIYAAGVELVKVKAEGTGSTRDAAISAALKEAVEKINGVSVSASNRQVSGNSSVKANSNSQSVAVVAGKADIEQGVHGERQESWVPDKSVDDSVSSSVKFSAAAAAATSSQFEENVAYSANQSDITTKSSGDIKSYNILKSEKTTDGFYVELEVSVAEYKLSSETLRKRVAVVPFRINNEGKYGIDFERQFNQTLVNQLTQSGKFAVLDRDYLAEQTGELARLQSDDVPVAEMAKLGNKLNTDYLLVGTIDAVIMRKYSHVMQSTGKQIPMIEQGVRLSYRLVDAVTGQVKYSDDYDNISTQQGSGYSIGNMGKRAGEAVAQNILINYFPVLVEAVDGDLLILGQGGDTIKLGDTFKLIKYGEEIFDSYTKESLGRSEQKVGTVEIVDVTGKLSKAKVIKSSIAINDDFQTNQYILRPLPKKSKINRAMKIKEVKSSAIEKRKQLEDASADDW
jgi:curli biogenesis system outer membrane secretion channel CsgG